MSHIIEPKPTMAQIAFNLVTTKEPLEGFTLCQIARNTNPQDEKRPWVAAIHRQIGSHASGGANFNGFGTSPFDATFDALANEKISRQGRG